MDTKQLKDALNRLFFHERERIVFWHDPQAEFAEVVAELAIEGVELIPMDTAGGLETKIRLEGSSPGERFLLYAPTEEPDFDEDWLLDIRLYSRSFRADRASIILDELGLESQYLRQHIADRRKFFDNKERLAKLKALVTPTDSSEDLDLKMLAVLVRAEQPELLNTLRALFHAMAGPGNGNGLDLGTPPDCWDQVEKFDLAASFWAFMEERFGYSEELPSLKNLLIRLMVTDLAHHLRGQLPSSLEHLVLPPAGRANSVVCLAQWRDSSSKGSSYDIISGEVARILHLQDSLCPLPFEELATVPTFQVVEQLVVQGLRDRILHTADAIDREAICQLIQRRHDGHWASLNIPSTEVARREIYHSAYEAAAAATALFALRNRHRDGLVFDSPREFYEAYETELFRFDQLYRHFCEAADVVETRGWDLLKELRARIEAVYVNWFLVQEALAWGDQVDPAGKTGLLKYWRIEGRSRQDEFYERFVRPQLEESDRRRVFVIISDGLRFEAAEELTQALNGKYRFEAELTSQLGVLPSYTSLGMASLLPHERLSFKENGEILVDEQPAASLDQRNKILESRKGMACRADELIALKKDEGRSLIADAKVVYIFHNTIDTGGESNEARTFEAVRQAIEELSAVVNYVVNSLNGNYVVVTSDHGFLFSETYPDETAKSTLSERPEGTVKSKRRYLLGHHLPDHEIAWRGSTLTTAGASGNMEFLIPRGVNRFSFQGSRLYFHGGAMLQEIVVPVITVRHIKGKSAEQTKTRTVSVQVLGARHKITTNQHRFELLQMEPVSERVKPITLKVAIFEGDQPVTDIETVTFESTSGNMDDRKRTIRLVLQNRSYDKRTAYRLVLRDAETGVEQASVDVVIDRAFTDDF